MRTVCLSVVFLSLATAAVAARTEVVAVSSDVARDYKRVRLPDGSIKPETYAFIEGAKQEGEKDESIDRVPFLRIARLLAKPLADDHYLPSADPKKLDLLIMVHWGTTFGSEQLQQGPGMDLLSQASQAMSAASLAQSAPPPAGAGAMPSSGAGLNVGGGNPDAESQMGLALSMLQMDNDRRDRQNWLNARILGMDDAYEQALDVQHMAFARDFIGELEMNRYFVVLEAFDFQKAVKEKKLKIRWITRFSIRAPGSRFDEQLASMVQAAAPYFGRNSRGLRRNTLPEGKVHLGEPRVVDMPAAAAPPAK